MFLYSIDDILFRQASSVGDRITVKCRVNYGDLHEIEVGARVEAHAIGAEARHITR